MKTHLLSTDISLPDTRGTWWEKK